MVFTGCLINSLMYDMWLDTRAVVLIKHFAFNPGWTPALCVPALLNAMSHPACSIINHVILLWENNAASLCSFFMNYAWMFMTFVFVEWQIFFVRSNQNSCFANVMSQMLSVSPNSAGTQFDACHFCVLNYIFYVFKMCIWKLMLCPRDIRKPLCEMLNWPTVAPSFKTIRICLLDGLITVCCSPGVS